MCTDNHIISFQIQFKIFIERFMNSLQWHQCFGSVSRFLCRRSGCCYWTMSLCMPMNMRLWFYVATVFIDDSFRIFFIIVLITQKSKLLQHYLWLFESQTEFFRILLTCIKSLAKCPCPRCYVPKSELHNMGMVSDTRNRNKSWLDTHDVQWSIKNAWKKIFKCGYGVESAMIECMMAQWSLIPVQVRWYIFWCYTLVFHFLSRVHSQSGCPSLDLTIIRCFFQTLCTSLSWNVGKRSLPTLSGFFTHREMILLSNSMHGKIFLVLRQLFLIFCAI